MGAWIEIQFMKSFCCTGKVAPLVGAWIEIGEVTRGMMEKAQVAPLVGAWIEILLNGLEW